MNFKQSYDKIELKILTSVISIVFIVSVLSAILSIISVISMDNMDMDYPFTFFLNYPYPGLIFVWIMDTKFVLWICIHG